MMEVYFITAPEGHCGGTLSLYQLHSIHPLLLIIILCCLFSIQNM